MNVQFLSESLPFPTTYIRKKWTIYIRKKRTIYRSFIYIECWMNKIPKKMNKIPRKFVFSLRFSFSTDILISLDRFCLFCINWIKKRIIVNDQNIAQWVNIEKLKPPRTLRMQLLSLFSLILLAITVADLASAVGIGMRCAGKKI